MANKIKLETALQKREFSKTDALRKVGTRELRAYFLIVCEGAKTEPNYFKSFPKMAGNLVFDLTFDGGGISTTKVLEKALEIRQKSRQIYDRIWIVFDKDSFPESHFNKAIIDAEKEGIKSAWSNEAFELWYLLHFAYRNTAMQRNEYQKALESHISNRNKIISYFKSITIKTFNPFEALLNVFCTFNRLFSPLNALFQVQNPFQNSSQKLRHYFIPIT